MGGVIWCICDLCENARGRYVVLYGVNESVSGVMYDGGAHRMLTLDQPI